MGTAQPVDKSGRGLQGLLVPLFHPPNWHET